jgi:hypothetical protein
VGRLPWLNLKRLAPKPTKKKPPFKKPILLSPPPLTIHFQNDILRRSVTDTPSTTLPRSDPTAVEHSLPPEPTHPPRPRRPDLSSFFSAFSAVDTSRTQNPHAEATPGSMAAVYRLYAQGLERLMQDTAGAGGGGGGPAAGGEAYGPLLRRMQEAIWEMVEAPPRKVQGVGEEFLAGEWSFRRGGDGRGRSGAGGRLPAVMGWGGGLEALTIVAELERIPKKKLRQSDICPICSMPFLDGAFLRLAMLRPAGWRAAIREWLPPSPGSLSASRQRPGSC